MNEQIGSARCTSNIAFIKYWGNRDHRLRLPVNGSISMNLKGLETLTTIHFDSALEADQLELNGSTETGAALERASTHLDHFRKIAGIKTHAVIQSKNNFPTGTGIASSASAFAALSLAIDEALDLNMDEKTLSSMARLGSGSASRSVPGGFVEWHVGDDHESSYAESIAPVDHWDLVDLVAIVSREHKAVGSTGGHVLAPTSPLQDARIADTQRRLDLCRSAILERDFEKFADVVEHDNLIMHAVMMTSTPALIYWNPATLRIIETVRQWRAEGTPVCVTIDAGPNIHVITTAEHHDKVYASLTALEGVGEVLSATPGGAGEVISDPFS